MRKLLGLAIVFLLSTTVEAKTIVKYFHFAIAPNGSDYFTVRVPSNAVEIKAVVEYHTANVELSLISPTGKVVCQSSSRLFGKNWSRPLQCEYKIPTASEPGIWRIKIRADVGANAKVKSISGNLTVYIKLSDKPAKSKNEKSKTAKDTSKVIFSQDFSFYAVAPDAYQTEIIVPQKVKHIKVQLLSSNEPTQIILFSPTGKIACKQTYTPGQESDWQPCSVELDCAKGFKAGIWKLEIKAQNGYGKYKITLLK